MSNFVLKSKISVSHADMILLKDIGLHIAEKTSSKIISHIIKAAHMTMQVEGLDDTKEDTIVFMLNQVLYKLDEISPEI